MEIPLRMRQTRTRSAQRESQKGFKCQISSTFHLFDHGLRQCAAVDVEGKCRLRRLGLAWRPLQENSSAAASSCHR